MQTIVRVNGCGNAWPVFLGDKNRFYEFTSEDLSNSSYSLISFDGKDYLSGEILWEILVDAGNHTAPFLIQHENRIPEAIVLTHGHTDHTLGIDWIAQSYFFKYDKKKRYPLYCTRLVWESVKRSYPQLEHVISYTELLPAVETDIAEVKGLTVTSFPVFHGSGARGASMLLFKTDKGKQVLFTGDMLCPLFRRSDFELVSSADIIFIDTNNRFPNPDTNHISFVRTQPGISKDAHF